MHSQPQISALPSNACGLQSPRTLRNASVREPRGGVGPGSIATLLTRITRLLRKVGLVGQQYTDQQQHDLNHDHRQ